MQTNRFFVVALICFCLSCQDDPDPRGGFVGTFEINDFEVDLAQGSENSSFTITSNPDVKFVYSDTLHGDELAMDLEEFIEDVMRFSFGELLDPAAEITVELADDELAEISGAAFKTNEVDFHVIISNGDLEETYSCELQGGGQLSGNTLTFEFEIELYTGSVNFVFSGTATGTRD